MWKSCERLGVLPPNVKPNWDDNDPWTQALIIAYNQVCEHDFAEMMGGGGDTASKLAASAR